MPYEHVAGEDCLFSSLHTDWTLRDRSRAIEGTLLQSFVRIYV